MQELRCRRCGRLLMRVETAAARIETVCPDRQCRAFQTHALPTSPPRDTKQPPAKRKDRQ